METFDKTKFKINPGMLTPYLETKLFFVLIFESK
jgi:hypothetical protein